MPTDTFKVAFFLPSLIGGGAERVMLNLACGFAQRGVPVDMVLAAAEGPYLAEIPPEVPVVDLKAGRVRSSIGPLIRYLRLKRPSVLLSALDHTNFAAVVSRDLARVSTRVAITLHNTPSQKFKHYPFHKKYQARHLSRYTHSKADVIIAVSSGVADDYSQLFQTPAQRIHVVYNPVVSDEVFAKANMPLDHPWFADGQPPVILAIGRLTPQKDFLTLIRAFDKVKASCQNCRLMILGEGEMRPSLEGFIKERSLQADVALPGFVNNPFKYLAKARLFVLSSSWEGLPTVLIEALAVGTPVISTNCKSGPKEILVDGKYGQLVPVKDPDILAREIVSELNRPKAVPPSESWGRFEVTRAVDGYLSLLRGCTQ